MFSRLAPHPRHSSTPSPILKVLVVEDSQPLARWLARSLEHERYLVECAFDGAAADDRLTNEIYDLVILDLALPKLGGPEVLRRLRSRNSDVPVMILTANNSIEGRVRGLDFGADDYLSKPFELVELEARMRALLRRSSQKKDPTLRCGQLAFDPRTQLFTVSSLALPLPLREHEVLESLINKIGRTVSKRSLVASLSGVDEMVSTEAIELYVHRLRRKLENSDATIVTLRGLGYLLKQRDGT